MKLVNRPDVGFTGGRRGEVVVMSPSVAVGYFDDPVAEENAFVVVGDDHVFIHPAIPTEDQPQLKSGKWYLTGDLGEVDDSGKLTLIDRVSAVCRTTTGVIIHVGCVEQLLMSIPGIKQAVVNISPDSSTVDAILVSENSREEKDSFSLTPLESDFMNKIEKSSELQSALQGVNFKAHWASGYWSVKNGMLNGELKITRSKVLANYNSS